MLTTWSQSGNVPFIQGTWVVTEHKAPSISAMRKEEADSWVGKIAQYTEQKAAFDREVCESANYKRSAMQIEDLWTGFRISPELLGYKGGPIEIVEVYCGNSEWLIPGSTLVRVGEDRLFIVWDGVFFHLQKR